MNRTEIIDLLLENKETVLVVINQIKQRLIVQDDNLFEDDIRSQFLDLVRGELANELYNKGLTISLLYDKIDPDEFEMFIKEVLYNE